MKPRQKYRLCQRPASSLVRTAVLSSFFLHDERYLPSKLQYSGKIENDSAYPYRRSIISLTRLFLVFLAEKLSAEQKTELSSALASVVTPSFMAEINSHKILSRPADLSAAEYHTLSTLMPMVLIEKSLQGLGLNEPFIALSVAAGDL
jgi:hypothetical protein